MRYSNINDLPAKIRDKVRGMDMADHKSYLDAYNRAHDKYTREGRANADDSAHDDAMNEVRRTSKAGRDYEDRDRTDRDRTDRDRTDRDRTDRDRTDRDRNDKDRNDRDRNDRNRDNQY